MLQTEVGTAQNSEQDKTEPLHHSFLAMLGSQLKHFWKIGIHWLTALRKLLDKPFDMHAIAILGDT